MLISSDTHTVWEPYLQEKLINPVRNQVYPRVKVSQNDVGKPRLVTKNLMIHVNRSIRMPVNENIFEMWNTIWYQINNILFNSICDMVK